MHDSERDRIFGEWLAGHKGILFKVVHAYAFEHADRQDLFQEITIQVWRSVDAFRGDSSVPTWMYRVALNTAIAWTRKEGRHQRGKKWRRIERWIIYVMSAVFVAGMALFLANMTLLMIYRDDMNGLTGWDLALPVVGAVAALISGRAIYVGHRAQALREQSFGESLRDQLNRSIAQLDYQATTLHRTLMQVVVLMGGICPIALLLALSRLNEKSFSDDGYMIVWLSLMCVFGVATGVWELRRQARDVVLPHKRRLEALLKELDAP